MSLSDEEQAQNVSAMAIIEYFVKIKQLDFFIELKNFNQADNISNIDIAASLIFVPGPKTAAAPESNKY